MTAITISRQLGSHGDEVGQAIADRLNYRLVSREVINRAAARAQAPEVALATIDDLGLLGLKPTPRAQRAYHQAVRELMQELAAEGNIVIIGRAGQVILGDNPGVLHIKVIAPASLRAERIARQQNIPLRSAQEQIRASDQTRKDYLRRYYHVRWDDPELYDLILNTARLTPEEAACLICQALTQCILGGNG
ncbi:MAG TPA: cytidylate kinase-like family protein [Anaerolineales bacterium]|jgi:cytidylate kinase|nr:cytidylate kinase-like family protein [Anaerolineales bacterium]